MKTLISILAVMLTTAVAATAQKEDNVWIYAGNRIDFNAEPPVVTPVSVNYVTEENITSVADRNGNLVYWLNGTSLYNSRDEVVYSLPVGEGGFYFYGLSIVPFPGREDVFLFVYPDIRRGSMVVSIADGSNDLLHPEITPYYKEFPYDYMYSDGVPLFFQKYGSRDFWMLYSYGGKINVYALTEDGFSDTGNEYSLMYGGRLYSINGCEMTPDRSKILATGYNSVMFFIDLDTKTGKINSVNPMRIGSLQAFAFSSGNKYLYYSYIGNMYRISVEKLATISTDDEFVENREFVGNIGCDIGDIKFLTSGGMYYLPDNGGDYLGMVRNCESEHPTLDNQAVMLARNALEHRVASFYAFPKTYCYPFGFTAVESCGGEVHFSYNNVGDNASLQWDFGDGTTSSERSPYHTYDDNGKYNVTLTVNFPSPDTPTQTMTTSVVVKNKLKKLVITKQ